MIIDISRMLSPETAVWPGDKKFDITKNLAIAQGDTVNLTTLTLSAHTATHVDAPYHFTEAGQTIEALALRPFWGLAQVVTITKEAGPLYPADFAAFDLTRAPRLLVRTTAGQLPLSQFPEAIVYPTPELAAFLAENGIILYGTDAPSMDAIDSKELSGHYALYRHGIAILEWLDLTRASDGLYELVALPLKIEGGDGSPVRAALRPFSPAGNDEKQQIQE